jgi:hypothetical protein
MLCACAWVQLTTSGTQVRVREADEVAQCQKLGWTGARTRDRIGIFQRRPEKVAQELEILARNEAANLGGDTIVAVSPITAGERRFDVYRCRGL